MISSSLKDAYEQSIALLQKASTPFGFVASVNAVSNYQRIWTRDGIITGLAALLSDDERLVATFEHTLHTLFTHQHGSGFFPSNVDPQTHTVSYGGNCGRVDNVSWALIGLMQYVLATQKDELAQKYFPQINKAFALMDAWEFNGKHLMYVPQSGNWADEYVQHGYILYDQLLRVWALELAGNHFHQHQWIDKASAIRESIRINFWNKAQEPQKLYSPNLIHQLQNAPYQYWLMGFNPARVYPQFDLAANALALLLNIGEVDNYKVLTSFIAHTTKEKPFLLPSFSPPIQEGDFLMQELSDNYAYQFRNLPHEFHNGGLWPVWNGWLCAALHVRSQTEMAHSLQNSIAEANKLNTTSGEWGFYENFHGLSHSPIGVQYCTWSASGYILAEAYRQGKRLK